LPPVEIVNSLLRRVWIGGGMSRIIAVLAILGISAVGTAAAQEVITLKTAVVALADEPEVRAEFEQDLVATARERRYDAITTYDLAPDVRELDDDDFLDVLEANGVRIVLMLRPAAIGAGASLESVRNEVSPRLLSDMQRFAKEVGSADANEMIAVVHMGIYLLENGDDPELLSSGAVWLDEEVESREQGLDRLHDLVVNNVDAVRPAIRRHLGLPPLE
jgi:hypothetical protein